jgi:cytochrome c-type biogenesis protein CcmF
VIRILGFTSIAAALALAAFGMIAALIGARQRRGDLVRSAEMATYACFGLLTISNLAMIWGLVTHDFSISYVAQVGSRSTPLFFTIISLWSSLEGSILFWGWVLAGYAAAAVYFTRGKLGTLGVYSTAVLLAVSAFFYMLLMGPANPWHAVWPVPADGPGPNPLLQNHWLMAVHPPLLYLGYVGMTVPFAFAIGALLSGRLDDTWLRTTRRWTITSWAFLSLAIMAGMWWSYEVLGWGGYWAWDPVENASFLPWLTATAFLHSVMVQERRGMLRVWNLSLIIATFILTILGTFLTRSGVLSSVHAFSEGPIGIYFLVFMGFWLIVSLVLLGGRASELQTPGHLDSVASRETAFLLNNLLLTAFTFTVLLGTLFPLVAEAVQGVKVSVGPPFFNRMTVPLMALLLFLMGVGPALPWRNASPEYLKRQFLAPASVGLLTGILAAALGTPSIWGVLVFAFAAFALTTNVQEYVTGIRARRSAHGEAVPVAISRMIRANPRRYGGFMAHIGVVMLTVGIAGSSMFTQEVEATLRPGQTLTLGGYDVRFDELWGREEPQRFVVAADLAVLRDGRQIGMLTPRLNFYRGREEPITTPSVRSRAHEDLYVNLLAFESDGSSATVHVLVEPVVVWIWIGGFVIAFGAFVAVWPWKKARIRRRVLA